MFKKEHSVEILLVEDSKGDVELTLEALQEARILNDVTVVNDGEKAITHIENALTGAARLPDIVLLDLNLPKVDGREVLAYLKGSDRLHHIPVIMLTTSKAPSDVLNAYDLHANSFVTKPMQADDFISAVRGISDYWLTIVTLPEPPHSTSESSPS